MTELEHQANSAEQQKERAKRAFDKTRILAKPDSQREPWEQQRLVEIEFEEEWEQEESTRQERAELTRLEGDVSALRSWFDLDTNRQQRFASEHSALLDAEGLLQREHAEYAAMGSDVFRRREWFQEDGTRSQRHADKYDQFCKDRTLSIWESLGEHRTIGDRLSAGFQHTLAIRNDGTVVGWGRNIEGECDPPPGQYRAVGAGLSYSLGLSHDGELVSWGSDQVMGEVPVGCYRAISVGNSHCLGLRDDGTIVAWGLEDVDREQQWGLCTVPSGHHLAISAGVAHNLALRENGDVVAWGRNDDGETDVPRGKFLMISAGLKQSWGLRDDFCIVGWGASEKIIPGTYVTVHATGAGFVGVRSDGVLVEYSVVSEEVNEIADTHGNPVGISVSKFPLDSHVVMMVNEWITAWGDNSFGQCDVPLDFSEDEELLVAGETPVRGEPREELDEAIPPMEHPKSDIRTARAETTEIEREGEEVGKFRSWWRKWIW